MDFVIELVGEVIEEALSWLISSSKVPKAVRYLIVSVLHIALIVLFAILTFTGEVLWGRILCGVFIVLFLVSWFFIMRKIKKGAVSLRK